MKALTILQPWATLIAMGAKKVETRSWATSYRGPLAIHAGKDINTPHCVWRNPFKKELEKAGMFTPYPDGVYGFSLRDHGKILAIVDLAECLKVVGWEPDGAFLEDGRKITGNEFVFGDYSVGRYAWLLRNVRKIDPVAAKGKQRLWEWEP